MDSLEGKPKPFYGFQDERLNEFARWWEFPPKKGEAPSDEEYRAMLAAKTGGPLPSFEEIEGEDRGGDTAA